MNVEDILKKLRAQSNPKNIEGMKRFGIQGQKVLGVSIPVLRKMAKELGCDHKLAEQLWETGIHEVRILASMVDEVEKVTEEQMGSWVKEFDSWDLCDQCCMNLFDKTDMAYKKATQWSGRDEEFVKRAGFALMACLAWHDKTAKDEKFLQFFPLMEKHAYDERNFVKKAVNWALRQIGKRSLFLQKRAVEVAERIQLQESKAARWIARDALRELNDPKTIERIKKRS